jgi:polysaccharide export outer membrane protein
MNPFHIEESIDFEQLSRHGAEAYVIGPEDALEISVWKEEGLKKDVLVRPDGGISFPLAGDMQAAGKTALQVQQELTQKLQKFIPDPDVTVSLIKITSYKVYVLGRVARPGEYPVGHHVNVLQALSLAGGLTPFSSADNIKIIRKIDGKSASIPFVYSKVEDGSAMEQNITLKSGDVVLVP